MTYHQTLLAWELPIGRMCAKERGHVSLPCVLDSIFAYEVLQVAQKSDYSQNKPKGGQYNYV